MIYTYSLLDGQTSSPGVAPCSAKSRLTKIPRHLNDRLLVNPVPTDEFAIIKSLKRVDVREERLLPSCTVHVHSSVYRT